MKTLKKLQVTKKNLANTEQQTVHLQAMYTVFQNAGTKKCNHQ